MADQRANARERAREAAQQAAAAASSSAASPAVIAEDPPPPPAAEEPDPPTEAVESPPEMLVPDPPPVPAAESDADSGTYEVSADDGSDTIVYGAETGYAVDLKFPATTEDGTQSGELDTEAPVGDEPPPPAVLPTPQPQPALTTNAADEPENSGQAATRPPVGSDGSGRPTAGAGPTVPGKLNIDPVRERLEDAAKNIQLPSQPGAGLAPEVTRPREILRETGVEPRRRAEEGDGPGGDGASGVERDAPAAIIRTGAGLDVFTSSISDTQQPAMVRTDAQAPLQNDSLAGQGPVSGSPNVPRPLAADPEDRPPGLEVANRLPPGLHRQEPAAGNADGERAPKINAPGRGDVPQPADPERDEEAWALHRTRLSLMPELADAEAQDADSWLSLASDERNWSDDAGAGLGTIDGSPRTERFHESRSTPDDDDAIRD